MTVKRINISLDPGLHSDAQAHAKAVHKTDFSGLVTKLLLADGVGKSTPTSDSDSSRTARRTAARASKKKQ